MDIPLLELLARQLARGRREASQLVDAAGGRYRERAVLQECVRPATGTTPVPNRLLCGTPAHALAALLSEQRQDRYPAPGAILVDLRPARDGDACPFRYGQWIPILFLLHALAPDAAARVFAPREVHAALRLVLDAAWPNAVLVDDATNAATATVTAFGNPAADRRRTPTTLVLAQEASRCLSHLSMPGAWVAFAPRARFAAQVRHVCVATDVPVDIAVVGAAPGEWTRRHAGGKPLDAMEAALEAFGATPLVATPPGAQGATRRRAGADVLLGECVRDGQRTLVWVDAPDRRTSDASLCRAITRRDVGAEGWDRVVVLGWHFSPTFAQQFALRSDTRLDAFAIRAIPRAVRRGATLSVDPHGFHRIGGLTGAWVDRVRSRTPGCEELRVTLQPQDADSARAIEDWSIDPDHGDGIFRGAWHASRDGVAGARSARLRLPWRAEPRRVCIRAFHPDGGISDVILVVRDGPGPHLGADARLRLTPPRHARVEALC